VNAAKNRAFKSLEGSVKKMEDLDRLGLGRQRNAVVLYWDTSATGFIYFFQFKYPVVFEHLEFKGHIHWNDELFGGYRRFVYEQGSANNSKTIVDAVDLYSPAP
jgi:hypothetical protein